MKYIPYIVIAVLLCVIILFPRSKEVREIRTTDTVTVHVTDTVTEKEPVYKYRTITDTMYILIKGDTVKLPKESVHYSKDSVYDVWISGFNPKLDSIKTYNKTKYHTVTNEVTREIYKEQSHIYLNGGLFGSRETFSPYVGVSISGRGRLRYGANIGINNGHPFYGVELGIKLK